MNFMNEWDIDLAVKRYNDIDDFRYYAARILAAHRDAVNANSDGWAHWSAPVKASARIIALLESSDKPSHDAFKRALTPLKTFYTKHIHSMTHDTESANRARTVVEFPTNV